MDGLININKPLEWTSFDVVAKVKGMLGAKKVGHTGTLDPLATGVLVLCIGKATKLAQKITDTSKEYIAEVTLGANTTTDDAEGEITIHKSQNSNFISPTDEDIEQAVSKFIGKTMQMPPDFSAKKIKGQRAYKLARAGKEVKLEPREITVHEIEILKYKWPVLSIRIACEKGTYIRSIARDLGEELNVGGYLTGLQRTKVGDFKIEDSIEIKDVDETKIIPIGI